MGICRHSRKRSTTEAHSKEHDERERKTARERSTERRKSDGDVTERTQLIHARIGHPHDVQAATYSTRSSGDLPHVLFRGLPAPMDGTLRRRDTGLGTGAENWVSRAIQVDLGALGTFPGRIEQRKWASEEVSRVQSR